MASAFVAAAVLVVWTGTDAQKSGSQSTRISCAYDTLAAAVSTGAGVSVVDSLVLLRSKAGSRLKSLFMVIVVGVLRVGG